MVRPRQTAAFTAATADSKSVIMATGMRRPMPRFESASGLARGTCCHSCLAVGCPDGSLLWITVLVLPPKNAGGTRRSPS